MSNNFTCDVCNYEGNDVYAGRWIFYCPKHEQNDRDITYNNEIKPSLDNGDFNYITEDGELSELAEKII